MTRAVLAIALMLGLAPVAVAHEGHDHTIMGTVSAIHKSHLEVKAVKDGKTSSIVLNDDTKVLREKTPVAVSDIRIGERVVVTAVTQKGPDGKERLVAREVRLAAARQS